MGQSPTTKLVFGIDFSQNPPWDPEIDWSKDEDDALRFDDEDDWLAHVGGLTDAEGNYDYSKLLELKREIPFEVEPYGAIGWDKQVIVCLKAPHQYTGYDAQPFEVDAKMLEVDPITIAEFKAKLEEFGVTGKEPKWLATTYYG